MIPHLSVSYDPAALEVELAPTAPPVVIPPPVGGWSLVPRPTNMEVFEYGDPATNVAGNSSNPFPFANSTAWNPITKVVRATCGDHGKTPRHREWNPTTNACVQVDDGDDGSHLYQNCAVNPYTGTEYLYVPGWANMTLPGAIESGIYKYDTMLKKYVLFARPPNNASWTNTITGCLSWWEGQVVGGGAQGALVRFDHNVGNIELLDPLTKQWTIINGMAPGRLGLAHAVSAFSKKRQLLAYGGGNGSGNQTPLRDYPYIDGNGNPAVAQVPYNRLLWVMDANGKKYELPPAPDHVGIWHGFNMVAFQPTGDIHLIGFGQHWAYDLSNLASIKLNRLPDPPAALLTPIGQGKPSGFMTCSAPDRIYAFNADRARTPISTIWQYQ